MKKWIAAALLAASGSAMADAGPFYVTIPGYCNAKKVFVTPFNQVYGYEIGCSDTVTYPSYGVIDSFGNVLLASVMSGRSVCMDSYAPDGTLRSSCSNGVTVTNLPQVLMYQVSLVAPSNALTRSAQPDYYQQISGQAGK